MKRSISHPLPAVLPEFCTAGVVLRALLAANLAGLLLAATGVSHLRQLPGRLVEGAALLEPALLSSLVVLCAARRGLVKLPYHAAAVLAVLLVAALSGAVSRAVAYLFGNDGDSWSLHALIGALGCAALLAYFNLRSRAYSPALAEARLQALQARIRPHFLFNSLNAVLSLIREEPRRAERALEDLADLFRVLMAEQRRLLPLGDELNLCRQYLAIEKLRLGERLLVDWRVDEAALPTRLPVLLLQPLIENAVYHGIEPSVEPGIIGVLVERHGAHVRIEVSNPHRAAGAHPTGNRMALDNIRERLALAFDIEARLDVFLEERRYRVSMRVPFRPRDPA